jgi:hypothetical protein
VVFIGVSPIYCRHAPRVRGIQYSRGLETNRWAAAYRIARSRLREGFDGHACQAAEGFGEGGKPGDDRLRKRDKFNRSP